MGISIAEMLGIDMPEEDEDAAASGSAEESGDAHGDAAQSDAVQEAVVSAFLAESTLDAEAFRSDLSLVKDLDLDEIGLYAVVASVEDDLKITLKDADIEQLETLQDLVDLAREAKNGTRK